MKEYQKVKKIQKLSNVVGCMKRIKPQRIELLLLVIHFVIIILCLMNFFITPWKILNNALKALRIVILAFLAISLICVIYNQIVRKRKKVTIGYYYCVSFFGSLISQVLIILNFIFILISCIVVFIKLKEFKETKYMHKSILIIDIICLIINIGLYFLWYSVFLIIYAKTYDSIKEYTEAKMRYFQSQNQKVVNIELSDDNNSNISNNKKNINYNNMKRNSLEEDIISTHKMEVNEKKDVENNKKKENDSSGVETK